MFWVIFLFFELIYIYIINYLTYIKNIRIAVIPLSAIPFLGSTAPLRYAGVDNYGWKLYLQLSKRKLT